MARSLTKKDQTDKVYTRPVAVEAEIDEVLLLDTSELRDRLLLSDSASPEFLSPECLVHLFRYFKRISDDDLVNVVTEVLLMRCKKRLQGKFSDRLPVEAIGLRKQVMDAFVDLLVRSGAGEDPDKLDYYEVRFNKAFRMLCLMQSRKHSTQRDPIVPMPVCRDSSQDEGGEDYWSRLLPPLQVPARAEDAYLLKQVLEAIRQLPAEERKAVVLRTLGHPVESSDPKQVTIATLCNCTGTTVHNRLKRARAKLSLLRETP